MITYIKLSDDEAKDIELHMRKHDGNNIIAPTYFEEHGWMINKALLNDDAFAKVAEMVGGNETLTVKKADQSKLVAKRAESEEEITERVKSELKEGTELIYLHEINKI